MVGISPCINLFLVARRTGVRAYIGRRLVVDRDGGLFDRATPDQDQE
jgi:hypothetical protein